MKIKLKRKQMKYLVAVTSIIIILFILPDFVYIEMNKFLIHILPTPVYSYNYNGANLFFRNNLRDAGKIVVIPNETAVLNLLSETGGSPIIVYKNITFAFKPAAEDQNPLYIVEIFELTTKLKLFYDKNEVEVGFRTIPVDDYSTLVGTQQNPVIALVHPIYANDTTIRVKDRVIFIEGKSLSDFDLATIKLMMIVFGIKL